MTGIFSLPGTEKGIIFLPVFPSNPYQDLLYNAVNKKLGFRIQGFNNRHFTKKLLDLNKSEYKYLHIHWLHPFFDLENDDIFNLFLEKIIYAKKIGYKLIWTVHNIISHESENIEKETEYRKQFAKLCDAIFVHGNLIKNLISETYCIDEKKIFVAPHGSYGNVYPNNTTRQDARNRFGIKENELTFLYFGRIRGYKGLDNLLEIFQKLNEKYKNTRLVIAGKSQDSSITELINDYAENNGQIQFFNDRIGNDEVQYYFNAADITVLPFKKILTSGSVLLSLTFMKPVITSNSGVLPEFIDEKTGLLFSDYDHLEKIMKNCITEWNTGSFNNKWNKNNFTALLQDLDWDNIVNKYYKPVFSLS